MCILMQIKFGIFEYSREATVYEGQSRISEINFT